MAGIKLSGSLPKQTVSTNVVKHVNVHKGEKPVSDEYGTLGSAKTHVQTYANGSEEVGVHACDCNRLDACLVVTFREGGAFKVFPENAI